MKRTLIRKRWLTAIVREFQVQAGPSNELFAENKNPTLVPASPLEQRIAMGLRCEALLRRIMGTAQLTVGDDGPSVAARARHIIIQSCESALTLKELCKAVGSNRTSLERQFRQAYGVSVHTFIVAVRIERAKVLLLLGNTKVEAVALQVGYHSKASFSRAFHRIVGAAPATFRDEHSRL